MSEILYFMETTLIRLLKISVFWKNKPRLFLVLSGKQNGNKLIRWSLLSFFELNIKVTYKFQIHYFVRVINQAIS